MCIDVLWDFCEFDCHCQCNRWPGKTLLQKDLVCIEWAVNYCWFAGLTDHGSSWLLICALEILLLSYLLTVMCSDEVSVWYLICHGSLIWSYMISAHVVVLYSTPWTAWCSLTNFKGGLYSHLTMQWLCTQLWLAGTAATTALTKWMKSALNIAEVDNRIWVHMQSSHSDLGNPCTKEYTEVTTYLLKIRLPPSCAITDDMTILFFTTMS